MFATPQQKALKRALFEPFKALALIRVKMPDFPRALKLSEMSSSAGPTRRREKIMGRFKSPRQAPRFLAAHDQINIIFKPRRYRLTADSYRHARADAFTLWADFAREMAA